MTNIKLFFPPCRVRVPPAALTPPDIHRYEGSSYGSAGGVRRWWSEAAINNMFARTLKAITSNRNTAAMPSHGRGSSAALAVVMALAAVRLREQAQNSVLEGIVVAAQLDAVAALAVRKTSSSPKFCGLSAQSFATSHSHRSPSALPPSLPAPPLLSPAHLHELLILSRLLLTPLRLVLLQYQGRSLSDDGSVARCGGARDWRARLLAPLMCVAS